MSGGALRVLVVEDEALLAYDIEAMVEDAGYQVVGEAASLGDVELLDDALQPDLAFVDIQLANGSSGLDVSRHIRGRWADTLIVFITANPLKIPEDFAGGHGVIPKPFSRNGLISALHYLGEGIADPPPASPRPQSFTAAPELAIAWTA